MKRENAKSVKSKRQKRKREKVKRKIIDQIKMGHALMKLRGNLTQSELAQALNISDSAIRMYESGSRIPEDDIKIAFAKYFQKSVEELFYLHLVEVDSEADDENDEPENSTHDKTQDPAGRGKVPDHV